MFKIESYITPLLMGYVDKYVKLRPEDFQLSLWGGDAVLYNLDLRLDVIEKAMQLPIVFQSGHIHELRLHIPWTKLGSDPVVVTINTIECILKLRDTAYKGSRSSRAGSETPGKSKSNAALKQKARRQDADDLPPGYLQSLMNKMVNNVHIIVNNLIVKFVEDDIVLSLNVKSGECYSVNKDWNRAFTELTAPDFVLRRAINFCDLTVCLDKRDASGKIEHYQDPLVYRCSVSCRLYTKYENIHAKYPLETKLNVFCERLDLSLTDSQLPMFIRLVELCLALYYGTLELKISSPSKEAPDTQDVQRGVETEPVGEPPPGEENPQGWVSWAWSYVPQIIPDIEDEEGEGGSGEPAPRRRPLPSIFSLGMYAYKLTVKFKLTEFLKEKSHYGPKKISFKPFLYLEAEGISLEVLMQGISFFDAQFGITNLRVYSQGPCICGMEGEENARNNVMLSGGDQLTNKTTVNYMSQSLFDQQSPENLGIPISKILDFEEHRQVYTEQYGMQKYGVFWMDYLYSMAQQEDKGTHSSKSSVSSAEEVTLFVKENSLSRFVIGQCHLNLASTTIHRVQKLLDAAYKYEYEPYSKKQEEKVDENRPSPTEEQLAALEEFIPTRTYHLTLLQPVVSFLSAEHPYCDVSKKVYRSHQSSKKSSTQGTLQPLFGIQMSSQRFDLQVTSPMYPRKLVQLVSKIAGPPSNLLHHCHSHTQLKLFGFHVGLTKVDPAGTRSPMLTVMPPASGAMYTRRLLLPMYWNNSYLPKLEKVYELPQINLTLTKPGLLVVMAILSSWKQTNPKPGDINANSLLEDVFPADGEDRVQQPMLDLLMYGFEMKMCRNDMVASCSGTVSSIQAVVYKQDSTHSSAVPVLHTSSNTEPLHTAGWLTDPNSAPLEDVTNDFITFTYQLPRQQDHIEAPSVVLLNVEGVSCCLDPVLIGWFSYTPTNKSPPTPEMKVELNLELAKAASPLQGNISQISQPSSDSKHQTLSYIRSATTVQQSSVADKDADVSMDTSNTFGSRLAKIFPVVRITQVQVEIKKWCMFLPRSQLKMSESSVKIIENMQTLAQSRSLPDLVVVCLPHVHVQSTGMKTASYVQEIPITSMEGSLVGDKIPWNVSLRNFSIYTVHCDNKSPVSSLSLVKPASVSCTVGVSYKYTPPTSDNISALGLCLHTDMHPFVVAASFEQVNLITEIAATNMKLVTKALSFAADVNKSLSSEKKKPTSPNTQGPPASQFVPAPRQQSNTLSVASVTEGETPGTYTSGDLTSLDTAPSNELEILENGNSRVKLSLWLQWTLPKCELRLYLKGKQDVKLCLLLEDLTMSVDVQDVYSKLKVNMGSANLTHYIHPTQSWEKGPNEGILMSCRDRLARDTNIVSSRLWSCDQKRTSAATATTLFHSVQPMREMTHGFLNLTFTRALRKNVKKRLQKMNIEMVSADDSADGGGGSNMFFFHKYVSEICISLNPCDFVLSVSPLIAILDSLPAVEKAKPQKNVKRTKSFSSRKSKPPLPLLTSSNLPLIYADMGCTRLFIPRETTHKECLENKRENIITTMDHDLVVIQVQSVGVTPHAENPLPRYAVDKALYQRAVQLGVTSESGAALTDRQYQVDVKGFTVTSGCWADFVLETGDADRSSRNTPSTQIPAVEWNALTVLQNDHRDIQLYPLMSPCDMKLVAAPAIVNNCLPQFGSDALEYTLVSGYAFEFNVVSDLDLYLSTNQLQLLQNITMETMRTFSGISDKHEDRPDDPCPDSGLGSEVSAVTTGQPRITVQSPETVNKDSRKENLSLPVTPLDMLLTAGRISCTLYTHDVADNEIPQEKIKSKKKPKAQKQRKLDLEWRVGQSSENEDEGGSGEDMTGSVSNFQDPYFLSLCEPLQGGAGEGKVIPKGCPYIRPFLFVYISQPHTVLSCQQDTQKFEMSCFDVLVKGPMEHSLVQVSEMKMLPDCSDYTQYWLETRAGQPDRTTGIPPCLYTFTVTDFLKAPASVALKFGRPIRANVSFDKLRLIQGFVNVLMADPGPKKKSEDHNKLSATPSGTQKKGQPLGLLHKVHHIELTTEQMVVSLETKMCEESPGCVMSFSNLKMETDLQTGNQGSLLCVSMTSYMRDLLLKTMYCERLLNLLGPCSVKLDSSLNHIYHDNKHFLSQAMVTMATGLVTAHVGQEHVLCIKMLVDHVTDFYQEILPSSTTKPSSVSRTATPEPKPGPKEDYIVHSSADDLRSGGFQYCMDADGTGLAGPGQIVFCNGDREGNSSMMWSYKQPRVISHISTTPIPFNISGTSADENQRQVECSLQYWEGLIQQFVDYVDISVSEHQVTHTQLPDIRTAGPRELVVAQTWRMVIRTINSVAMVLPASLAAAMKIDSCFIPSLIPSFQLGCTMESTELHLSNHVQCLGKETPSRLRPFTMSCCYPATGEFAVVTIDNILLAGSRLGGQQGRFQAQFTSQITVDLLEFRTLTMQRVVSSFELSGMANLQPAAKPPLLDIDVTCEPVTVRLGHGMVHTLSSTLQAWNQILADPDTDQEEVIFGHYVICNDTQRAIRFGQVGTDENLVLQPREMHQYGWRSHKMKQELHVCLDGPVWKWCDALDINRTGTVVRAVTSTEQQYTLVISIQKLSNIQIQVIISGQLAICNQLTQHLEVKVMTSNQGQEHRAVVGSEQTIPSYILEPQDIAGIKFRPWASRGLWSKEVLVSGENMKETNLIKITLSDKSSFHIWCRIFTQALHNAQQIFVVLCPLYTVRSHLPYPLYVNIDTSKLGTHQQIEAPGRGRDMQLVCPGGDIHHALTFQFSATSCKSTSGVTLSTGLIDQLRRFPASDISADQLNATWKEQCWYQWPYIQDIDIQENAVKPSTQSLSVPEVDSHPTIDLSISLSELWPGCPTVLVEVIPAFLVNNMCKLDLVVMGTEDIVYNLPKGSTLSPPKLEGSFHVGVSIDNTTHMSAAIPISEAEVNEQRYRNDIGKTLYVDSYVNMPIFVDMEGKSQIYFVTVSSIVKHQIRVITVRETYNFTNLTKYSLSMCPVTVPHWSDKVDIPFEEALVVPSNKGCRRNQSDLQPLTFHALKYSSKAEDKHSLDHNTEFIHYLTFGIVSMETQGRKGNSSTSSDIQFNQTEKYDNQSWSFPIRLSSSENGSRMTLSVTVETDGVRRCEAICVTGQQKNGVTYFVIQADSAPTCYITNRCKFPLYFGQTLMNLSLSGTTIQEQTELLNSLPIIPVEGSTYYTPPYINSTFPQISDTETIPRLHISGALLNPGDQSDHSIVKWSQPVDLQRAADHFVSIPGLADVKVHVHQVAMVTMVTVEHVTKADVSAKEIRSRLKGKERTIIIEGKEIETQSEIKPSHGHDKTNLEKKAASDERGPVVQKKQAFEVSAGLFLHKVTLVIQDELSSNTKRGELLRLTLRDMLVAMYPASEGVEQFNYHRNCLVVSAGDIQLDNQLQMKGNYDFPVVIVRQNFEKPAIDTDYRLLSQMHVIEKHAVLKSNSIVHIQVVISSMQMRSNVIESVEISAKPMNFYLDDAFIFRCIKEFEGFIPIPLSFLEPLPVYILKLPSRVKSTSYSLASPVLIGHLLIQPLSVLLSVHASLKLFVASDHTPLTFSKFEKAHLCTSGYQMTRVLVMHYASGALFRAGAVVGSLEILGNPTGLVRSIGTGVADFFRMPYRGLTKGPGAFVVGVSRGTSSMVKNITTGMLKSVTNFASSVSRNMDRLSLDGSHVERQEESRRHRPDGVGEGLIQGLTGLGISLLGAVAGLADQPLQSLIQTEVTPGSRASTASGLMTGVGKGLVGVFTKPIGGAAEFVSQTGQGILHGTGLSMLPKPQSDVVAIAIEDESCGQLKYALKLLQSLPSNDILLCVEASFIDLTDSAVPVTLILTPEILFVVNHEEDSQQQSFSLLELQCGVTLGDHPVLSIIWRDAHTFADEQLGPSDTERVTAFIDGTSGYVNPPLGQEGHPLPMGDTQPANLPEIENKNRTQNNTRTNQRNITDSEKMFESSAKKAGTQSEDEASLLGDQGSATQVENLSGSQSDASSVAMDVNVGTLPQYDFHMSATKLAAFLAIFNITKHKLEGIGFSV